jgi:hypothetical protein
VNLTAYGVPLVACITKKQNHQNRLANAHNSRIDCASCAAEAELQEVDAREKEHAAICARWRRSILDQWQAAITGLHAAQLKALPARIRDLSAQRLEVAKAMLYGGALRRHNRQYTAMKG